MPGDCGGFDTRRFDGGAGTQLDDAMGIACERSGVAV